MIRPIPVNLPDLAAATENRISRWGEFTFAWRQRLRRLRRMIPMLVWYGDEVDVTVTILTAGLGASGPTAISAVWEIQDKLRSLGLTFDSGSGLGGRDWEWDWSLRGPIRIAFRGRNKTGREPRAAKVAHCASSR